MTRRLICSLLVVAGCAPAVRPTHVVTPVDDGEADRRERAYLLAAADGYLAAYDAMADMLADHATQMCELEADVYGEDPERDCSLHSANVLDARAGVAATRSRLEEALSLAEERDELVSFARCLRQRVRSYLAWDAFLTQAGADVEIARRDLEEMLEHAMLDLEVEREQLVAERETLEEEREALIRRAGELSRADFDAEEVRIDEELAYLEREQSALDVEQSHEVGDAEEQTAELELVSTFLRNARGDLAARRTLSAMSVTEVPQPVRSWGDPLTAIEADIAVEEACHDFGPGPLSP